MIIGFLIAILLAIHFWLLIRCAILIKEFKEEDNIEKEKEEFKCIK